MNVLLFALWILTVIGAVWVIDGLRTGRILADVFQAHDVPLLQRARCRIERTSRSGGRVRFLSEDHYRGLALRLVGHRALFLGVRE